MISQPLRIYIVPRNKNLKKLKKDGTTIAYKCPFCPFQSFNLNQTKRHMNQCSNLTTLNSQIERN